MKTLILIFVLLATTCLYSTVINVPGDQPTIQAGIVAAADTDTVLVADGTYFENINYNGKNITIASLFLTTQDTIYISQTIIDGNQNGCVVGFLNGETTDALLIGFTITNGNSPTDGGGILISNSSPTLTGNVITENTAAYIGGGVYTTGNSSPVLINNIICNNTSAAFTGGIAFTSCSETSHPTVENCQIYGNTASINAGGLGVMASDIDVINCTISDNHSGGNGGGVYVLNNADANIINCTIKGNTSANGGGIAVAGSDIVMINTIVEGNEAVDGNGIYFSQPGNVDICFNDFFNGLTNFGGSVPTGLGDITGFNIYGTSCDEFFNIYEDPLFAGIGDHPFSLLEDSPCIDSGIQDTTGLNLPLFDIIGNERIVDGRGDGFAYIDMGAYEYYIFIADFEATPTSGTARLTVQFEDLSIGNPTSWEWDFDNDGTVDSFEQSPGWTYEEAGTYSVSLTIGDVINQSTEIKIDYIVVDPPNSTQDEIVTLKTELIGNYPNPFNPTTTISFFVTQTSPFVTLEIYNIKGQKVKQLISSQLSIGQHLVIWNGTDENNKSVSSGIYFYKLKSGNFEKTKKMILMK